MGFRVQFTGAVYPLRCTVYFFSIRVFFLKSRKAVSASPGMQPKNWDRAPTWLMAFVLAVLFMGILLFATDNFRRIRMPAAQAVSHGSPAF